MGQRSEPPASEITAEAAYLSRRQWITNVARTGSTAALVGSGLLALIGEGKRPRGEAPTPAAQPALVLQPSTYGAPPDEPATPYADITRYNNFYEFGVDKSDPWRNAGSLRTRPWTVQIEGEVARPRSFDIDALLRQFPQQERTYRMRCVEAWSMVIPWVGFPLGDLVRWLEPTSRAKYVAFTTLLDREQMPGQRRNVLDWPYVEALRIDEAIHPLTLLATGLYGKALPSQNGAPLRLVVPWKYGFKGIKSIVKIAFTERQPPTSWNLAAPDEYGFYANVNPMVDHPRWSQATERRIGEFERRRTLPFNGYGEQVAGLYRDLDLRKNF